MNTTTLRADTLARLADPSPNGIYTTAQVDAALSDALGLIAPSFPTDEVQTATVAAGDIDVPGTRVVRVRLPDGYELPRRVAEFGIDPSPYAPLFWYEFAGNIQLTRPVRSDEAGTWTIELRADPEMPPGITTDWPLPESIAGALTALAAASLIRTRLAMDARRGHRVDYATRTLADDLHREAQRIIAAHKRRARGSI